MIESSAAYLAAITGDTRRVLLKAVIHIIDPDMQLTGGSADSLAPWAKTAELYDYRFTTARYATLEQDRWLLDGSFDIFPDDYQGSKHMGVADAQLSGANGSFASPAWAAITFSDISVLQAFSVYFPTDELEGVAEDFTVEVLSAGQTFFTKTVTGNTASAVAFEGFTVQTPDTIRVTVTKWSLPSRRMRVVEILPGVYEEWTEDIVAAFDCKQQGDVSCLSLPYGTCTLKMDNLSRRFEPRSKSGLFQSIEERQGVETYIGVRLADGTVEYKRVGVFYQYSDGWKTGDNGLTMQWDLVDIIGLLADRAYLAPTVLPITLSGWIASLVSQLGTNFADRYTVDADYGDLAVTASSRAAVSGKKCGDILRWACMATGTWPRADAETGKLAVEPLWNQGSKITLENLVNYPTMKANQSLASLIFHLSDGTEYVVSGNSTSSEKTVTIENPFLHTQAQALTAARLILSCYGGNQLELTGRGDPASEIGDVDTVWLDESSATTARRIYQTFQFSDGVLQGCQSKLLQADGSYLYTERAVFTESGSWTAPAGKTQLFVICVGHGGDGTDGEDGNFARAGKNGVDGLGGLVWADTIQINEQQTFAITIGEDAVFGPYSSANGKRYPNGYSDIRSGDSFARAGVPVPKSGTGDGGKGGRGGSQGRAHNEPLYDGDGNLIGSVAVTDVEPGKGTPGVNGVAGCVVVYWDKEESA